MLYLLPNLLSSNLKSQSLLPLCLADIMLELDGLIAESQKEALRYLKRFPMKKKFNETPFCLLNEHTKSDELDFILAPLLKQEDWGLISDAGLPAIADPGSELVLLARKKGIRIRAIPGPSSIFLALMLSGFPSQRFTFHGYPPRGVEALSKWAKKIEIKSKEEKSAELFIEAPYRNQSTLNALIGALKPVTYLSISQNLTGDGEWTKTLPMKIWRRQKEAPLPKEPAIFLVYNGI